MAVNFDQRIGAVGSTSPAAESERTTYTKRIRLDFTDSVNSIGPIAATDTVQIFDIPANSVVHSVTLHMNTVESTASTTVDIGDGTDADAFIDGGDITAATSLSSLTYSLTDGTPPTLDGNSFGDTFYAEDAVLTLLAITNGIDSAILDVVMEYSDVGPLNIST